MSFAIITSRPSYVGGMNSTARGRTTRICRSLAPDAYSGSARQLFHRGIVFIGSSAILFVFGAILTGLGYYAVLTHVARALGPMCIALAMLLVIVAARYLTLARRLSELAELGESRETTTDVNAISEGAETRGDVVTIIAGSEAINACHLNESHGFRFQQADFLPPPTYDSAVGNEGPPPSQGQALNANSIPLTEQEPPPPYVEVIKNPPNAEELVYTEK